MPAKNLVTLYLFVLLNIVCVVLHMLYVIYLSFFTNVKFKQDFNNHNEFSTIANLLQSLPNIHCDNSKSCLDFTFAKQLKYPCSKVAHMKN